MQKEQKIGKYVIHEHLGSGAYADVFKAHDPMLDRYVALKLLKPMLSSDADTRARFLKEARALAKLEHPNIAWVHEIGQEGSQDFIAMRYIEGPSLDKYLLQKGTLSWEEAYSITKDIATALQFSHNQGMIHRDVKPANIILGPHGAVLTDFGLVKSLDGSVLVSRSGKQMIGTWWYMAFLVFTLLYTPCMVAVAAARQEFGVRYMLMSVIGQLVLAWEFATAIFQIGKLLGIG